MKRNEEIGNKYNISLVESFISTEISMKSNQTADNEVLVWVVDQKKENSQTTTPAQKEQLAAPSNKTPNLQLDHAKTTDNKAEPSKTAIDISS